MILPWCRWHLAVWVLGLTMVVADDGRAADMRHFDRVSGLPEAVSRELTALSDKPIPAAQQSCERDAGDTVGEVVVSMEAFDAVPLSYACAGSECWVVASSCAPGQTVECGQRFLRFRVEAGGRVDAGSFQCVDVP